MVGKIWRFGKFGEVVGGMYLDWLIRVVKVSEGG